MTPDFTLKSQDQAQSIVRAASFDPRQKANFQMNPKRVPGRFRLDPVLKNIKFRIPIALKLISITAGLLLVTAGGITLQSTGAFENISELREKDSNRDQSLARATEVEGVMSNYIDKINMIASLMTKEYSSPSERDQALELTFRRDRDLVSVEVISLQKTKSNRVVNQEYLAQYQLDESYIEVLRERQKETRSFPFEAIFAGMVEIRNSSTAGAAPLITIGLPLVQDDFGKITQIAVADIRLDRLQQVFGNISERTMYLIDREGRLLAHPDEEKVFKSVSMTESPVVEAALKSQVRQGERENYTSPEDGRTYIGAYTRTPMGVTVIAEASRDVILEGARKVRREAFYTTGRVLSVALFLIFVFSITLTGPIEKLVMMTTEVAQGNFDVKSDLKASDEVGQLGRAFDSMLEGLKERDKVKNLMNKFHGSSITDDLMKGDLQLGGSRKEVTVFFSDIRDFTKFSEGHTPEEVVEMLNEYFQIMVGIINRSGGVVDKFIGDAIMAVWGAPTASERDSQNAIRACIEMRESLAKLNELRASRGTVPIKIGMGLHRGDAISGTIGSEERMEYTVIGDAVNQAARIEASTKAFGTDLLISDSLADTVASEFVIEEAGKVEVKGKSKPLTLFKVRGYINEAGEPVLVKTAFSDYEAEGDDKVKMAS